MMIKQDINSSKAVHFGWPFWFIGVMLMIVMSCGEDNKNSNDSSPVIARVGETILTKNELNKVFPNGWDKKDEKVKDFVRIWSQNEVISLEAQRTLSTEEKDFSRKIKDYKNSLLKHTFQQKLIDTLLSVEVSEDEVKTYFDAFQKNFELKENIVRVRYVKVPKDHKKFNKIKYLIQYKDSVQKEKFFEVIKDENLFCEANDSLWVKLHELKSLVPFKLYNDEHFLRNYKYTEAPDGEDVWIVYFSNHRLKEGVAPIEMVADQIKAAILNKRKLLLIQKKEAELYQKALKNGELQINLE